MAEFEAKHTHRQNEDYHAKMSVLKELTAKHGHRTKSCHPHKSEAMKELKRKHGYKQQHCHPHKSLVMAELKAKHSPQKQEEEQEKAKPAQVKLKESEKRLQAERIEQTANYNKSTAHQELLEKHGHKQKHTDNEHKPCFPVKKGLLEELKFKRGHQAVDSYQFPPLRDDVMLAVEELKVSVSHVHHTKSDFKDKSAVLSQLKALHGHKTNDCYPAKMDLHAELEARCT